VSEVAPLSGTSNVEVSASDASSVSSSVSQSNINKRNTLTPAQREELEKKRLAALASVNPQKSNQLILGALNDDSFSVRLSKHLDDFRRGEGYLSSRVPGELYQKSGKTASLFAAEDPSASALYNAYSTGLGYESRARFIQGLSGTANAASELRGLSKRLNRSA